MIQSLYEFAKKWSEKGSVYIISDPHFDDNDCKLMNPNWPTPEEYLKLLPNLTKQDTLVCLGDCGDLKYFKDMLCYKVLIKGNHDDKGNNYYLRSKKIITYDADTISIQDALKDAIDKYPDCTYSYRDEYEFHSPFHRWIITADNNLFDEVYSGPLFISDKILLSHEPVLGLTYCLNIHGHVHNASTSEWVDELGAQHINLAADSCNYTTLSLKDAIKSGVLSHIDNIHRKTIDHASKHSLHLR